MERAVYATIGGTVYPLVFTVGAAKSLGEHAGGFDRFCSELERLHMVDAPLNELAYYVSVLANEGIKIKNTESENRHNEPLQSLTPANVVEYASTAEILALIPAVFEAVAAGMSRGIRDGEPARNTAQKKKISRIDDSELFIRLLYYGTVHLNRPESEIWLMPLGSLFDLIELHRQYLGLSEPEEEGFMSQVMPDGI